MSDFFLRSTEKAFFFLWISISYFSFSFRTRVFFEIYFSFRSCITFSTSSFGRRCSSIYFSAMSSRSSACLVQVDVQFSSRYFLSDFAKNSLAFLAFYETSRRFSDFLRFIFSKTFSTLSEKYSSMLCFALSSLRTFRISTNSAGFSSVFGYSNFL